MIAKRLAAAALMMAFMLGAPQAALAADGDQTTFKAVSGYAAGKGCAGGREGKDESASGETPSQHSVEIPGGGWAMGAVAYALYPKLKGCEGTINGVKVKVMDTCKECNKNGKIDINHNACDKMDSSNAGETTVTWRNCQVNQKNVNPAIKTKN